MTLPRLAGGVGRLAASVSMFLATAGTALAQSTNAPMATVVRLRGSLSDSLPVDSTEQALGFFPGVGINDVGQLVLRGGPPSGYAVYLDGVPIAPGYRSAGTRFASDGSRLGIAPNAFSTASLTLGVPAASLGNGGSGVLAYASPRAGSHLGGSIRYGTDEVLSAAHGLGINRVEGRAGGPLGSGLSLAIAGMVMGQASAETGKGSNAVPIFVRGGIDTTVGIPTSVGDPFSDTVDVEVPRFLRFRGDCAAFAGSSNPGIADNYGGECAGARNPASAVSVAEVLGTLRYRIDDRHAVWLTVGATQDQRRLFDYLTINVPQQLQGQRSTSRLLTIGLTRQPQTGLLGAGFRVALSFQLDQDERGPLTAASDAASWHPWGGFLLSPLDLAFGLGRFPVDEDLVENYRLNRAGSRRSPYDLENPDQYQLISRYRSSAYGLNGFAEGGGPVGRLAMVREGRATGAAQATWRLTAHQGLTVGGEYTAYDLTNYNHALTVQTFSDVYLESPALFSGFAEDRFALGRVTIVAGLRYDHFSSGAERPYLLDLSPVSPTFNTYVPFPRPGSYRQNNNTAPDGRALTIFRTDDSHSVLSPRLQLAASLNPSLELYASAGRQAQTPDFAKVYAGINTDLSITNPEQIFGDDLGFEKVNVAEVGVAKHVGQGRFQGAVFAKHWDNLVRPRLRTLWDPLNGRTQDILLYDDDDGRSVRGFELSADGHVTRWIHALASYSLAVAEDGEGIAVADVRPHTVSGIVQVSTPRGWRVGSTLGRVLGDLSLTTAFRFASGTAYTRCPAGAGNDLLVTGDACAATFVGERNAFRLPSVKQVDLRLSKGFEIAGTSVNTFVDVRNAIGADRVRGVFLVTGTTQNDAARDAATVAAKDSYALEGSWNGVLRADGALDLTFGTGACDNWLATSGVLAPPNCVLLIRAEERFGNGDGVFDPAEQDRAIEAYYQSLFGTHTFLGAPRRVRLGFSVGF